MPTDHIFSRKYLPFADIAHIPSVGFWNSVAEKTYSSLKDAQEKAYLIRSLAHQACEICKKEIMVSSPDFPQLCLVCGRGFLEMMRAVAELSVEMAGAYGVNLLKEGFRKLPGVPVEEIEMRMELNRLKDAIPNR